MTVWQMSDAHFGCDLPELARLKAEGLLLENSADQVGNLRGLNPDNRSVLYNCLHFKEKVEKLWV